MAYCLTNQTALSDSRGFPIVWPLSVYLDNTFILTSRKSRPPEMKKNIIFHTVSYSDSYCVLFEKLLITQPAF